MSTEHGFSDEAKRLLKDAGVRVVVGALGEFEAKYQEFETGVVLDGADTEYPIGIPDGTEDGQPYFMGLREARELHRDIGYAINRASAMQMVDVP